MASEERVGDGSSERDDFRLRLLIDGTRTYAIFALDPDGTVASWNAGAECLEGYSAGEIVGKHFSVLYPPEAIADGRPEETLALAAVEGCWEEEGWRVRRDGSRFRANMVVNALRGQSGALVGFGVVARDITAHKDFEAKLAH